MLIPLLIIALITAGGLAVTYLVLDDDPLMVRLSAGLVIGSAVFTTVVFVTASLFGFGPALIVGCAAATALPALIFKYRRYRRPLKQDIAKAKGKLQGADARKLLRFAYYAGAFILLWFFFRQAVYELKDGIYTGGSQNLGDLPFHLGAIFSFTEINNFPPQNPSWAGAKFAYPFIADLFSASLLKVGAGLSDCIAVPNTLWAFSTWVLLERFTTKLTGSRLAGRLAPLLLFLSGGLGFLWFISDVYAGTKSAWDVLWQLPRDYTINNDFRWGNPLVVLFMTQRSFLLGMPLSIIALQYLWLVFTANKDKLLSNFISAAGMRAFLIGIIAGLLPLIHLHSLLSLFVVTAVLFAIKPDRWREWVIFGVGVATIAVPELLWSITGTASDTSKFFEWKFGWDKGQTNFFWFWLKNTGFVIPGIAIGLWLLYIKTRQDDKDLEHVERARHLLYFYIPFALLFIISNIAKLAPWEWDNVKVLIYWFVGSIPLLALVIVKSWDRGGFFKGLAATAFAVLIFAGALDVFRTITGQVKIRVFDEDSVKVAEQAKRLTVPKALFLNAPTYNSPVVLTGRQSLMRYSGHLSSHGIDYSPREADVKVIYTGGPVAEILLNKYNIDYVLISPEERNTLKANEDYFKKYAIAAESGLFKLYKIK
jgi:hypothetical protein